jgi:hypothetical protein
VNQRRDEMYEELEELINEFFNPEVMEIIGSDHHKNRDGLLEISYNHWLDNPIQCEWAWAIRHPGYCRADIEATGRSLREAIANFKVKAIKVNCDLLVYLREIEEG